MWKEWPKNKTRFDRISIDLATAKVTKTDEKAGVVHIREHQKDFIMQISDDYQGWVKHLQENVGRERDPVTQPVVVEESAESAAGEAGAALQVEC